VNRKILGAGFVVAVPLLLLLAFGLRRDPHQIDSPLVGLPAPAFSLSRVGSGPAVDLASLRGKPVVVNFWATWCQPCFEEHAVLVENARTLGAQVQFVGIVYEDEAPNVVEYLRREGSAYPALVDPGGRTAIAYGVYGVPETFFINASGVIVAKHVGPLTAEKLRERVQQARGAVP
jgi:cytochrome c biogenesis protein CcmG/thiol:disulfide interchange protein DsbE